MPATRSDFSQLMSFRSSSTTTSTTTTTTNNQNVEPTITSIRLSSRGRKNVKFTTDTIDNEHMGKKKSKGKKKRVF
jgi:hypothetical protein